MKSSIFRMDWAVFCSSLRSETLAEPFLVLETEPGEKPAWRLYAKAPQTLVQVMTVKKQPRSWRSIDAVVNALHREFDVPPVLTLYGSVESVVFEGTQ